MKKCKNQDVHILWRSHWVSHCVLFDTEISHCHTTIITHSKGTTRLTVTRANNDSIKASILLGGLWRLQLSARSMKTASKAFQPCWHRKHISVSTPSIFIGQLTPKGEAVKLINSAALFSHTLTSTHTHRELSRCALCGCVLIHVALVSEAKWKHKEELIISKTCSRC